LASFTDLENDLALLIGWHDYERATKTMPIEAQVHQAWYFALHPEKLEARHSPQKYADLFPKLRSRSRIAQKRLLNTVIKQARMSNAYMADPRTDNRPLMLDWSVVDRPNAVTPARSR
jgi:hypothetical protein